MHSSRRTNKPPQKVPVRPMAKSLRKVASVNPHELPACPQASEKTPNSAHPSSTQNRQKALTSASLKPAVLSQKNLLTPEDAERQFDEKKRLTEQHRRNLWIAAFALPALFATAFYAGFSWKTSKRNDSPNASSASTENQTQALQHMDDAVHAKYHDRFDEAKTAAQAARNAAPDISGVDVVFAEIALTTNHIDAMRQAARASMKRGQNRGDALMFLGLEKWIRRRSVRNQYNAIVEAKALMTRASEEDMSNMIIMFFRGDIESSTGDNAKAQKFLLGSLYRQQPWVSAAIISAKMQLAEKEAREASHTGDLGAEIPVTDLGRAFVALHQALISRSNLQSPLAALRRRASALQIKMLLNDQAFDRTALPKSLQKAKTAPLFKLPSTENKKG